MANFFRRYATAQAMENVTTKLIYRPIKSVLRPIKSVLRPFVVPMRARWRSRHPDLLIDEREFAGFQEPLKYAMVNIARTRFYNHSDHQTVPGMISPRERQMLYAMGRWLPGPVVEIGSWLGLSTTAIARGICDSRTPKKFDTFDLKLTPEMLRPVEGGRALFLPGDPIAHGACSEQYYQKEIFPFINAPGGSNRLLVDNLERLGLSKFVVAHVGDFRSWPAHLCSWVFCDALHDLHEIEVNAPYLQSFLQTGSVLACHDVGGRPELVAALREKLPLGHAVTVDLLYVAEVA
jgi:hypothetical protein